MLECSKFEVRQHEAAQAAVEEEQVDLVPLRSDAHAALPVDEREVTPQFQEERLHVGDQPVPRRRAGRLEAL